MTDLATHLVGILADGCSFSVEDTPSIRAALREKGATILHAGLEERAAQTLAATIAQRDELDDDGYLSRCVDRLLENRQ